MKPNIQLSALLNFLFLSFYFSVNAQQQTLIDSLEKELTTADSDSLKIGICNTLSWEWSLLNFEKAENYAQTAIWLSLKTQNKNGQITGLNRLATACNYAGKTDSVLVYYQRALALSKELNDKTEEATILNNIGVFYHYQAQYQEALVYYLKVADIREQLRDTVRYANVLNNIGLIYRNTNDLKRALYIYRKALNLKEAKNDTTGICSVLNNISVVFHDLGNFDSALVYSKKSIAFAQNTAALQAEALIVQSSAYQSLKQYHKAITAMKKAVQLTENNGNSPERVKMSSVLAHLYEMVNDYENALSQQQKTLEIAQIIGLQEIVLCTLNDLANIYAHLKNYEKAFQFKTEYVNLKNNIDEQKNKGELNELKTKFETELKDKELKQTQAEQKLTRLELNQKDKNMKYLFVLVFLTIVLATVLLYFFLQKDKVNKKIEEQRRKIEAALTEKEALLREIHHRVKNNLQIILGLLELQEMLSENSETKKLTFEAQNRIKAMSITHEILYKTYDLSAINLAEYVLTLVQSIEYSFSSNLHVEKILEMEDVFFNIDTIIPLGLILNELMTNSYKYAFRTDRENKLSFFIQRKDNNWQLIYGDNGNGLPPEIIHIESQKSFGLRLINMLVRQLKGKTEYWQNNGAFFIITFQERQG